MIWYTSSTAPFAVRVSGFFSSFALCLRLRQYRTQVKRQLAQLVSQIKGVIK